MIAKAKAVAYGVNILNYISGESRNKKDPEKIRFVCNQFMDPHLSPRNIFHLFELTCRARKMSDHRLAKRIKDTVIKFEISPLAENTQGWSVDDWRQLWRDFAEEFDRQVITGKKGRVLSERTNIAGSKAAVRLHLDSRSGVPHIHAVVCRVDQDGNINNSHEILRRAQEAGHAVALRRGWVTAEERSEVNKAEIRRACMSALTAMPRWSWADYQRRVEAAGYRFYINRDTNDEVNGYSIISGNSRYPSSQISLDLKPSQLEITWRKKHRKKEEKKEVKKPVRHVNSQAQHQPLVPLPTSPGLPLLSPKFAVLERYTLAGKDTVERTLEVDETSRIFHIPEAVDTYFLEEFSEDEYKNFDELQNRALELFLGLVMPGAEYVPVTGGGGGSGDDKSWGRDPREDELEWARRCARVARAMVRPRRYGMKR